MKKVVDRIPDGKGGYEIIYADVDTVNVLGTEYTISFVPKQDEPRLKGCDGFCDETTKEIVVENYKRGEPGSKSKLELQEQKNIRHEIVHAFLFESGLAENSEWAYNEEMVDWFAKQGPKIIKAWQEAKAL